MKIDSEGVAFIKRWEGKHGQPVLNAYLDTGGVPTIGFGHVKGVCLGQTITEEEAEQFLLDDLEPTERAVNHLVNVELTQHQYNSLISFTFNLGSNAFANSTLLKHLNAGEYDKAAAEFRKWDHDNGKEVQGLLNRRLAEKELFLKE